MVHLTYVIKKNDIYLDPKNSKSVIGSIYPGTEITKIGKDKSGKYIKAKMEFYIPLETLKEGRIAKRIGDTQIADNAMIKIIQAKKDEKLVIISVEITNKGEKDMDMSALLLFKLIGKGENIGNLEFMQSKNSVGIIKPGTTLRSELVYSFQKKPEDVELTFQSKLGGDQVFYLLGF
jgi:hypothetical protein